MTIVSPSTVDTQLDALSEDECRVLLGSSAVGRIAFVVDGLPIVLPVNYRLLSDGSGARILLRSRPGRAIDRAPEQVAFEIDGIDHAHRQGWSVLIGGLLRHLDPDEVQRLSDEFDPTPWPQFERTTWLAITPRTVTGRRLKAAEQEWALPSEAYL